MKIKWIIIIALSVIFLLSLYKRIVRADVLPSHVWTAISDRVPNEDVDVDDYEYSGGIGSKSYQISGLTERENGNYYKGGSALIIPTGWSEIEWFMREAQDIDNLSARAFYKPFKYDIDKTTPTSILEFTMVYIKIYTLNPLKVGMSYNTQHLKEGKGMLALSYHMETKYDLAFTFSYENNFQDRTVVYFKTGIKIPKGNFYYKPYTERREATGRRYFRQTKTEVGWEK